MEKTTQESRQEARQKDLIALFGRAPIKKSFEMDLSFDEEGRAVFEMPHQPSLEHALGDTHGGVLATLLDNAGWFAVAARYDSWVATVELQVRLLEPARKEALCARGWVVRAGKSLAVAEMEVRGANERLIAIGAGTFSITSIAT